MAVRGPKGPPLEGINQAQQHAEEASDSHRSKHAKKSITKVKVHTEPTQDEFDRIAESLAGSDMEPETGARRRRRQKSQRNLLRQTVARVGGDVSKLEQDASRILAVLASRAYDLASLERHRRELLRIRTLLDQARKRMLKARRALIEVDSALADIPESDLQRVHQELDRLEAYETEWGRALAAIELASEVAGEEGPRRLVVRGSERHEAMVYAERANPTTAIADLAASALRMVRAPKTKAGAQADGLGRSLDGQQLLQRMINPVAGDE